jgi:hypothetical protein
VAQQQGHRLVACRLGLLGGRRTSIVARCWIGAMCEEQLDHRPLAKACGDVERGGTAWATKVDLHAFCEQSSHDGLIALADAVEERTILLEDH